MSYQAVGWAMYEAPMLLTEKGNPDSTARQVLAVLAEHANDAGRNAHPSVLRIRWATGLDERTIQRALVRLERGGLAERDGVHRSGTVRWKLNMDKTRPASDLETLEAEAEEVRRLESERRKARRHRAAVNASGTENPGQAEVSGTESAGRPARRIPASGTQSTDVRHAAPPEPPREPPLNHPKEPPSLSQADARGSALVVADPEDRERDGMDQEEENAYQRLLRVEAGIHDRDHADRLIYGADHLLQGGPKGLGWWKKVIRQGDLPDVIAEIEAALGGEQSWPASPADERLAEGRALAARIDARIPLDQKHPFQPGPDGRICEVCYSAGHDARHRPTGQPDPDPGAFLDRRYARVNRAPRHQPFRNPEPSAYEQPL